MAIMKPQGYEEVQAAGEWTPIDLGGHKLVVMQVTETQSKNGRDMLKLEFDTAADDKQPKFYANSYKNDTRDVKKWGGVTYIMPTDMQGMTSKQFKSFCTSIEKSNPGYTMQWGEKFCDSLKGKKFGGVFGMEEYLNNVGEVKESHKLFWYRSVDGVADAKVPAPRLLDEDERPTSEPAMVVMADDDIPF